LLVFSGAWALLAAVFVSLSSIPVILRALPLGDGPKHEPVLRVIGAAEPPEVTAGKVGVVALPRIKAGS
jgi:hypothetical protein